MANVNFQSIALGVYLFICLFDFVLVPVWYGVNRPEIASFIDTMNTMKNAHPRSAIKVVNCHCQQVSRFSDNDN